MRPTMREVFDQLVAEGLFAAEDAGRVGEAMAKEEAGPPWFVKALMGVGAWVATGMFLVFLGLLDLFDSTAALLIVGPLLVGAAVFLRTARGGPMATQTALSMSLVGQVMLVFAIAELAESLEVGALALLALSVLLIWVMPDPVHRFLSTLAVAASLFFLLYVLNEAVAPTIGFALLAAGTVAWWLPPPRLDGRLAQLRGPVGHGLAASMLVAILPDSLNLREGNHALIGSVILAAVVLWVEARLFIEARGKLDRTAWVALAVTALIAVATARVPGLQAALAVLLLSLHRREPLLFGEGATAFVFFLGWYYYALELSLLHKSLVLVVSGAALLAIWRYLLPRAVVEGAR